jgi:energy-coupling factor transport system permease protein
MTTLVPTYRRTGSALHVARPAVAIAYVAAPCVVAVTCSHPLVLAAALASVVAAGLAAELGPELARAARLAIPLALLVALVNPIVSREGLTVLLEGPVVPVIGPLDITLEAVTFGALAALRVLVVVLAFALYSAAVDPDEVLRAFRRLSFRSALAASLATRLVPVLGRDAARMSDAYSLRAAVPVRGEDRLARLRRGALLTRALAAGALERAVDVAAALEVRGYALAPATSGWRAAERRPLSRHDVAFALASVAMMAMVAGAQLAGLARFHAYPTLQITFGVAAPALAAAIVGAALAPFWLARMRRGDGP